MTATSNASWLLLAAMLLIADETAQAQLPVAPIDPNQRQVYLVRKDQSDCTNSDVANVDSPLVSGNVWVTRLSDGNTDIKVALTATPNTTYHFFLKCARQLTEIHTDDEGVANIALTVPTSATGDIFAFDMYPEGAPSGNKFQSANVTFK